MMPEIETVFGANEGGRKGFIVRWKFPMALSEGAARFRARAMTTMRFPSTVTDLEIIRSGKSEETGDIMVDVFVPTEGFLSAGIQNPIEWVRENFPTSL